MNRQGMRNSGRDTSNCMSRPSTALLHTSRFASRGQGSSTFLMYWAKEQWITAPIPTGYPGGALISVHRNHSSSSSASKRCLRRPIWSLELPMSPKKKISGLCCLTKSAIPSKDSRVINLIQTRNDLRQKYRYKKRMPADSNKELVPKTVEGPDSPKKNERLVRIINTQHMPRRVDLHCTPSPVLPD